MFAVYTLRDVPHKAVSGRQAPSVEEGTGQTTSSFLRWSVWKGDNTASQLERNRKNVDRIEQGEKKGE